MKLLVVTEVIPFRSHSDKLVTAVNVISSEMIRCLHELGHDIVIQCFYHPSHTETKVTPAEAEEINYLKTQGIEVLQSFFPAEYGTRPPKRLRTIRLMLSRKERLTHYYPSSALQSELKRRIDQHGIEAVFSIWSPEGVAALDGIQIPHVAYQADIEHVPMETRLHDPTLFDIPSGLALLDQKLRLRSLERLHLSLMGNVDRICNIAACNHRYYEEHGFTQSAYTGSMWKDGGGQVSEMRSNDSSKPFKIIGHAGNMVNTGSTYGLKFLIEILPHLQTAMRGRPYEVHVIGAGEPVRALRDGLKHPSVVRHGFVPDLDAELLSADLFCIFNNVGPYLATFTRQIIAWSMGLCCVTHERSRLPVPETTDENVIMGGSPKEVAEKMAHAAFDPNIALSIRRAGRATFEKHFRPEIIAAKLDKALLEVASRG